jgi:hypothetical protein
LTKFTLPYYVLTTLIEPSLWDYRGGKSTI